MIITRVSIVTGVRRSLEMDVTEEQMEKFKKGELIQRAMPHLSPGDREFILNGTIDEEWDQVYPKDGPDDIIFEPE